MKLRKIKLITSFTALFMVASIMAVGVWAAASQSFNVRTTVTFTATGVSGTILGTLTGMDDTTYYYNTTLDADGTAITFNPRTEALSDWILGTETALKIGNVDGIANDITYTFTITNSSTTDLMNVTFSAVTAGTNLTLTSITQDDAPITDTEGTYATTGVAASGSSVFVATFNVVDEASSITSADISFNLALTNPNADLT